MPLLILVLAGPLVVFFVLVAACAWATRRERIRDQRRQQEFAERRTREHAAARQRAARERAWRCWAIPAKGAFEIESAPLWQTQVAAMQLISAAGRQGVLLSSLRPLFGREAARYPELYDGLIFEDWLEFLEQSGLAMAHDGAVTVTHLGREFLLFQEQRHWTRLG